MPTEPTNPQDQRKDQSKEQSTTTNDVMQNSTNSNKQSRKIKAKAEHNGTNGASPPETPEFEFEIDLDAIRIPQDYDAMVRAEKLLTELSVRKPHKTEFVRTRPGFYLETLVLYPNAGRDSEPYIVMVSLIVEDACNLAQGITSATLRSTRAEAA